MIETIQQIEKAIKRQRELLNRTLNSGSLTEITQYETRILTLVAILIALKEQDLSGIDHLTR